MKKINPTYWLFRDFGHPLDSKLFKIKASFLMMMNRMNMTMKMMMMMMILMMLTTTKITKKKTITK